MSQMNNDKLLEAILYANEWKDVWGLIHVRPKSTSQNGVLFTAEWAACLMSLAQNSEDPVLKTELENLHRAILSCEKLPGLLQRHPGTLEGDSMDNHIARLAWPYIIGRNDDEFAKRMKLHGETVICTGPDMSDNYNNKPEENYRWFNITYWLYGKQITHFWNCANPDKFTFFGWFGRSPGMMGTMEICATGTTSLFKYFSVFVAQMISAFTSADNLDSKKLAFMGIQPLKNKNWFWKQVYRFWYWRLTKQYKTDKPMKEIYAKYFKRHDHPIIRYCNY